ncbi:MAG: undecaprenyl-diphosphatase [Chromatiales bacterium 21-64-14]|nr:MAG: undecaprenyl-diphosphatase [Chromatiales bacterium 21-64-14]HQU15829.1 undecaprenyl-diphosphate phosphatase [Gammaproteobacteria bacterium]
MDSAHILLFAVMQGVTELFPISSLGHGVLLTTLLHWNLNRHNPDFLPFLVVLHLGTAGALFLFFWRDWMRLFSGLADARGRATNPEARLFWLLVVATIPAGLLGLALEKKLRLLFSNVTVVAVFLALNGLVLLAGDRLKRRETTQRLDHLSWGQALLIGCAQSLALIPGMSRSGVTLVAGLANGLDYGGSARFSFLMATPIIGAAGLLEVPKLFAARAHMDIGLVFLAGLVAGGFAYASTWVLMRYFNRNEVQALRPFAYYCMAAGAGALFWHLGL